MSNSIWKTPDQKPEENKLIFAQHDRRRDGNIDYFIWDIHEFIDAIRKDSIRWCYLDELIAQADKAERLQKAVDLAIETLKFYADGRHYKDEELDLSVYEWYEKEETGVLILDDGGRIENGKKARDAIKQLIKGEIDDK